MGDALKSFNKRVKDINDKFTKQMDAENKNHEILLAQNESTFKTALDSEDKKIDSLQKIQDQEVKDIFEDERTLLFIEKMR